MSILGTPTINGYLFYTGKIAGYCVWVLFFIQFFRNVRQIEISVYLDYCAYVFSGIGIFLAITSILNLGKSTTFGLPTIETQFKTSGLYQFSRNPMYAGFGLMTIGSVIHTANIPTLCMALFSLYCYHLIILGEEKFLTHRFGDSYIDYCKKVRRYF